jgi:hypoxanthine phosphoribosyltransferase/acid phosphatase family membrane protein YuiD
MLTKNQITIFISIITLLQPVLNILLKYVFHYYSKHQDFIKRPNATQGILGWETLGMPSGHTETTTVLCLILMWHYKLPIKIGSLIILTMMLQRIVTKMHTLRQVIAGLLTGLTYSYIYILTGLSYKTLIFILTAIYTYLFLIEKYITKQMKNVPEWIDKEFMSIIKKKQNRTLFQKINEIFVGLIYIHTKQNGILYYSYEQLKNGLDIFIDKLNSGVEKISSEQIDVIVGIKTGGAILGKYIADRLNKPYYSIKPQHTKFECKKKDDANQVYVAISHLGVQNDYENNYKMCETITEDIKDKSILLIDETISSGGTMKMALNYLKNVKQARIVYPYIYNSNNMFPSISNIYAFIWPWGYDN